ncbi:hypothetical protein [Paludisphaera mucosa]|uniref:Ankyrin repeat domain-containing protein n=1 Tax=Paludisphaera mucosa TaxID=3030827 RepID=A0ABT6FJH3_9BACT|nr:hypothetical protein [Paludisphaera mucosa]MDG3007732.1 hypothetical protein [Paludisphaera mucosa]
MAKRHLPVRPDLDQLRRQAKDLMRQIRRGDAAALADLAEHHPERVDPGSARLADSQLALARSYGVPSWPRLVLACRIVDAIWLDDEDALRTMLLKHPTSIHETARGTERCNWGPPLSYAANLGRDRIIAMLHGLGATDLDKAIGRATLQGRIDTARKLYDLMGRPQPPEDCLGGPAYTLSATGTALMFEFGARVRDADGRRLAPVDVVLETDSRKPAAKHQILEMYVRHGLELPDTPTMALHRGRIDLLEDHLRRDPLLIGRTFSHEEIYPPELGCHDEVLATHGTPLGGATLLHMCADYGEIEIAAWLLDRGMDPDAKAEVDADGFGGHTALFSAVVSQVNFWPNHSGTPHETSLTRLLLDRGADPTIRASLRKRLHPGYDEPAMHVSRDVTPLSWGERFHFKKLVSAPAMKLIAERMGLPEAGRR